jgi:hypothetical protein
MMILVELITLIILRWQIVKRFFGLIFSSILVLFFILNNFFRSTKRSRRSRRSRRKRRKRRKRRSWWELEYLFSFFNLL